MRDRTADFLVIALMCVILGAVAIGGYTKMNANSVCLSHGYASSSGNIFIGFYCVKRVDQTDVVVPIGKVIK